MKGQQFHPLNAAVRLQQPAQLMQPFPVQGQAGNQHMADPHRFPNVFTAVENLQSIVHSSTGDPAEQLVRRRLDVQQQQIRGVHRLAAVKQGNRAGSIQGGVQTVFPAALQNGGAESRLHQRFPAG